MAHLSPDSNFEIDGQKVIFIDMRFEIYPKEYQPFLRIWMEFFSAPLGNGKYLNFQRNSNGGHIWVGSPIPGFEDAPLPPDWWDYAHVAYADGSEKEPTK